MPAANFVVLTSSRTGSTWLVDLLNRRAGLETHGELFLGHTRTSPAIAGRDDYPRFIEMHGRPGITRLPRVVSFLNGLYKAPRPVGFKLMYAQLRGYPEILGYVAVRRIHVVHLTRSNHIDVLVSEELARLTGRSHTRVGVSSDTPKIHLDPDTLIDRIENLRRKSETVRQLLRFTMCPSLEVTYEALIEDEKEFFRILDFLEVSGPVIQTLSSLVKRGVGAHRDAIANFAEIQNILKSTPYSHMVR
jgi:LPS sulfotransferase NodH